MAKGEKFLPDGRPLNSGVVKMGDDCPSVPIRGIVPDMRVIEGSILGGEVEGDSLREGLARGREYLETVEGTDTEVVAQPRLRERIKEEKGRPKRRKCGKV